MSHSVSQSRVKVVHPVTGWPTEQLISHTLRERDDLIRDKSFLRCSIHQWDKFRKVCDEQLGADLLLFIVMLIEEVLEEVDAFDGWVCQSDNDHFTIIDRSTIIPEIRKSLQQRFAPEVIGQHPWYVSVISKQIGGNKIPTSLKLVTEIITANDFFQIENQQGKEAS